MLFCNKPGNDLHQVMTKKIDEHVLACLKLGDGCELLGKRLVSGDMIVRLSITINVYMSVIPVLSSCLCTT